MFAAQLKNVGLKYAICHRSPSTGAQLLPKIEIGAQIWHFSPVSQYWAPFAAQLRINSKLWHFSPVSQYWGPFAAQHKNCAKICHFSQAS
jgi:hypothetical protein